MDSKKQVRPYFRNFSWKYGFILFYKRLKELLEGVHDQEEMEVLWSNCVHRLNNNQRLVMV
ncbi:hypothetical protein BSK56_22110 [Paenibacillus borealis]|uniref:Transposase IS204/IS1001/IS1096/IS1165 DDE domain-containing protein n=1 Tax=Paenibacillus borealis TaxID=160799 RepID=A0ABX3H6F4_PAEBO|nr:hypothetical protein BSK56_22110 [Paenibacillus borealis]